VAKEKAESYRRLSYNHGVALADAIYREADIGGVHRLLNECPQDLRNWEWQRLDYISDEALMTLRGDGWSAFCAGACSPDGKLIASGGWAANIRVWDLVKGEQLRLLRGHADCITSLQFSPDGRYIASGSADRTVRVWDVASGETAMILRGHETDVCSVAFSPDSKWLASGADTTIRVWDLASGKELMILRGHHEGVTSIAFSPDGKHIASGSSGKGIKLWDVRTGEFRTLQGDNYSQCVAFSPDGRFIVSSGTGDVIRVINVADGSEFMTMRGHNGIIRCVAFSPDGRVVVSCGEDNTVRTWDAETGVELRVLRGHEKSVTFVLFTPDGSRIVSGSEDSTIKIWDPHIDRSKAVLHGHKDPVSGLAFTPDNKRLVSGSRDGTVKVWDVASGAEIQTLHKHEGGIASVALSPDGKLVASGGWDNTVRIWDIPEGEERMVLRGHKGEIRSIAFSPDGKRIVSGSQDGTVKVWDVVSGDQLMNVRDYYGPVWSVAVSPDGRFIASGGDGDIIVWDSLTGNDIMELSAAHSKFVSHLAFSHDGKRIVSGGMDATMQVWDVATGEKLMNLQDHSGAITFAAFTQDGARLISSNLNGRTKVWDLATGQELTVMERNISIPCGALSPDERTFATGCADGSIVLWQRAVPPEGYGPRQTAENARAVVDQLHSEQGLYHGVIDKLNNDTTLTTRVRQVALQIANSRRWEDTDQLIEKSWEAVRSSEGGIERYQAALEQAREAQHLEPNNRSVLRTLGVAQYRAGAYAEAIKTLVEAEKMRNAKDMSADLVDIAFTAMSYYRLEQTGNARMMMEKLRSLFENGQYDDSDMARDVLIEAESLLVGENAELRGVWHDIRLGNIDAAARKIDELRSLQEAEIASKIEGVVKYLGRAYCQRGGERLNIISEYASKIADYESAVHFDPNRAASLNDLAWLRATCPVSSHRDAIRAVQLATKACEQTSWQNHEYVSTLAAACSEMGDFDSAIRWQEKASSLLPKDCPTSLRVNYEARLGVYQSHRPYHKGSLWSFSDGELVAHWKFDDINAAQVLDSSGHGLHGRFVGDAHIISDPERGNVLSLDGDGDYVQFKEDLAFDITGAVTIAAWVQVRKSEIDQDWTVLTGGALWFHRNLGTSGVRITGMFTGSTNWDKRWFDVSGNVDVSGGKWHHVAGVHDGSKFSLYVDGILDDFQERGGILIATHSPVYIGGYPFTQEVWNGLIDDVHIYSYALSPEEVKMLYEGKEPPRERRSE
jgi:WD40 repeat protein/tetratricopeptide (TPR) repeat protein